MAVASALSKAGTGTGISTRSLNNIVTGTSTEKNPSQMSAVFLIIHCRYQYRRQYLFNN